MTEAEGNCGSQHLYTRPPPYFPTQNSGDAPELQKERSIRRRMTIVLEGGRGRWRGERGRERDRISMLLRLMDGRFKKNIEETTRGDESN